MPKFKTLDDLIQKWMEPMRRAFSSAFDTIRSRASVSGITRAVSNADFEDAIVEIDLNEAAFWPLETILGLAVEDAGAQTMVAIPQGIGFNGKRVKAIFNMRDPRVIAMIERQGGEMITRIVDDQKEMIRNLIADGLRSGRSPNTIALDLVGRLDATTRKRAGGALGLSAPQEEWTRRYREELRTLDRDALRRALRDKRWDASIGRAIATGRPLPADLIERAVAAYRNNALRLRGTTVAEAEIKTAVHAAQMEAYEQALALGQVDERQVTKTWRSRQDKQVRDSHQHLNGQVVPFRGLFTSLNGVALEYPGDPRAPAHERIGCRCRMLVKVEAMAYA